MPPRGNEDARAKAKAKAKAKCKAKCKAKGKAKGQGAAKALAKVRARQLQWNSRRQQRREVVLELNALCDDVGAERLKHQAKSSEQDHAKPEEVERRDAFSQSPGEQGGRETEFLGHYANLVGAYFDSW